MSSTTWLPPSVSSVIVTTREVGPWCDSAGAGTFTADCGPDGALEGTFDAAVCAE
jgi:hypothetical protein